MEHIIIDHCPSCHCTNSNVFMETKDWFLSQEDFRILRCLECSLHYTENVPRNLGDYYKSDDYISHSEEGGIIKTVYQLVQNTTLKSKQKLIKKHTTGNHIIDYGAGKGDFLLSLKTDGFNVSGYEPDKDARALAQTKNNIELKSQVSDLPNEADAITMWHVLEHIPNPNEIIELLKSKLKGDGVLIVAVPNIESFDANHYRKYWAAYDVPRHLLHFSAHSMKELIERNGMKIIQTKPMWFDSTYVSLLSEKYVNHSKSESNILNGLRALIIGGIGNIATLFNRKRCSSLIYIIKRQ